MPSLADNSGEPHMRIIDLHCYAGTRNGSPARGPTSRRSRSTGTGVGSAGARRVLKTSPTPGSTRCWLHWTWKPPLPHRGHQRYVHAMWKRHPGRIIQAWGASSRPRRDRDPAVQKRSKAWLHCFHFHPIMQHFAVNDHRYYPLSRRSARWCSGDDRRRHDRHGAGCQRNGARIRHAILRRSTICGGFPTSRFSWPIGWPWVDEATAVALHRETCTGRCPAGRRSIFRAT